MDFRYLDVDEVLRQHQLEVGKGVGLSDRNLLEAAVERPRQSAFGEDAYPTFASKAAALLDSLARNHPFIDGNKRIAVLASFVFLEINGYDVEVTDDESSRPSLRSSSERSTSTARTNSSWMRRRGDAEV